MRQAVDVPLREDGECLVDPLTSRVSQPDQERCSVVDEVLLQADRFECSLRRYYVDEFFTRQARLFKPGAQVLDLGGQKSPKRGQFCIDRYNVRVCYANLSTTHHPDVQIDAAMLPFRDKAFDMIVCAEVLEHAPAPRPILQEAYRVLRPGGVLLITAPFLFPIHADPHDYARYTEAFWEMNLKQIGFKELKVEAQGFFWSVATDMVRAWLYEMVRQGRMSSSLLQRISRACIAKGKYWALARDHHSKREAKGFLQRYTTGYGISVVRP